MATRFEIVLHGDNPVALRAAAEEALDEVQRIEARLSLYRPDSEVAHLNARAALEPVRVSSELFGLVSLAKSLSEQTLGAFDITIGPLMKLWGFMGTEGTVPDPDQLAEAKSRVGMDKVILDYASQTVHFSQRGLLIDLGSIGKGYAIDRAVELLREAGVANAFVHGGTSTSYGLGVPDAFEGHEQGWKVAVERPETAQTPASVLAIVPLRDSALSVSAVWGKSFRSGETTYGHVIDPRTGAPATQSLLAAVSVPSATESDALSTALLVLASEGHRLIRNIRPTARLLTLSQDKAGNFSIESTALTPEHCKP